MDSKDNRKLFGMIIECTKLTSEIFEKAVEEMIRNISNNQPQGKTTLKKMARTGKVDSIAVSDKNIGSFGKTARKYNLTYALKRIQSENGKKQYLVVFHGKDLDTMQRAFKEYAYAQTHKPKTLFSKKKVSEIDIAEYNKQHEAERQSERDNNREHKREIGARSI